MTRLKPGVYKEKCSLETKLKLNGKLRAKATEIARRSDIEEFNAYQDLMELERRRRINPKTGEGYYI